MSIELPKIGQTNWGVPLNTALLQINEQTKDLPAQVSAVEGAVIVAEDAAARAEAAEGTFTAPANEVVATMVTDEGPTKDALSATIVNRTDAVTGFIHLDDLVSGEDCTTQLDAAANSALALGLGIRLPAGTFYYSGSGFPLGDNIALHGAARGITDLRLAPGSRLIDRVTPPLTLHITDMIVRGGEFYRSTGTGTYTTGHYRIVERVRFVEYTGTVIDSHSADEPWWKFTECLFRGADYVATKGVRLSGYANGSVFEQCDFDRNRVHVELGNAQDAHFVNCGLYRLSGARPNPTVDVWFRPTATPVNAHFGWSIESCKFGNENILTTDKRIVVADDDGTGWPDLDSPSTGYVTGGAIRGCNLGSSEAEPTSLVYSTTPNLRSWDIADNFSHGGGWTYLFEWLTAPGRSPFTVATVKGWNSETGGVSRLAAQISNHPASIVVDDGLGLLEGTRHAVTGGADPAGYIPLSTAFDGPTSGAVAASNETDSLGRAAATRGPAKRIVFSDATTGFYGWAPANPTVGRPTWIEMDLREYSSLSSVMVRVVAVSGGAVHWQRVVRLTSAWRRHRWFLPAFTVSEAIRVEVRNVDGEGGAVEVSRPHIYHAPEPVPLGDLARTIYVNGSWDAPHLQMGSHHLWVDGSGVLRIKSGAPASATDGTPVGAQG